MGENITLIGKEYPELVIPLLDSAKRSIYMCMFDWRWYKNDPANPVSLFNSALLRAHRRGVEVRILTNYAEVIAFVNDLGLNAKKWPEKSLLHSKFIVIDRDISIIGSHNITFSAFTSNMETSVLLHDEPQAEKLRNLFNTLWQR